MLASLTLQKMCIDLTWFSKRFTLKPFVCAFFKLYFTEHHFSNDFDFIGKYHIKLFLNYYLTREPSIFPLVIYLVFCYTIIGRVEWMALMEWLHWHENRSEMKMKMCSYYCAFLDVDAFKTEQKSSFQMYFWFFPRLTINKALNMIYYLCPTLNLCIKMTIKSEYMLRNPSCPSHFPNFSF